MKKIFIAALLVFFYMAVANTVSADGCYMCEGNTYVNYTGTDNATKRKAAKACGCKITGTRGPCTAANLKVLCTVQKENKDNLKLAQKSDN